MNKAVYVENSGNMLSAYQEPVYIGNRMARMSDEDWDRVGEYLTAHIRVAEDIDHGFRVRIYLGA